MQETDTGLIPELRRSPGGGHGSPLQYSCLENPMDRGAWQATVHGVAKSQTRLSHKVHYLFWTCMHAKSLQSCLTLRPHGLSLPGSYIHGIFQARILEWTAMPSSRGSSWPRNRTRVFYISCIGRWVIYHWATWESPILPIYVYICRHCSWHQDLSPNNTNQLLSWSSHSIVRKTGNKKQQKN